MGGNSLWAVEVAELGLCVCVCQDGLVVRVELALSKTLIQATLARARHAGTCQSFLAAIGVEPEHAWGHVSKMLLSSAVEAAGTEAGPGERQGSGGSIEEECGPDDLVEEEARYRNAQYLADPYLIGAANSPVVYLQTPPRSS